jgi:AcrR family transcriptional regulator
MSSPSSATGRRAQNDARVLNALHAVAHELGSTGLTLRNVADRAQLSRAAVSERYPSRSSMLTAVWSSGSGEALAEAVTALLAAHDPPKGATAPADRASIAAAWRRFSQPSPPLRSALDLLLTSPYDAELSAHVAATAGVHATGWTRHNGRSATRRAAARRGYLIARALGLLAIGSMTDLCGVDFAPGEWAIEAALRTTVRASRLPVVPTQSVSIETGEPTLDALLHSTIEQVARHGFAGASIEAICAGVGISKGYLFNRYATKRELFIDASRRRQRAALAQSAAWLADMSSRQGQARAEATYIRTVLHANNWVQLRVSSEDLHLALHEREVAQVFEATAESFAQANLGAITPKTLGYAHGARAIGEGFGLLTHLDPDAWQLPFEVVLVPLQATLSNAYLGESLA